jgi:hypothetical protein
VTIFFDRPAPTKDFQEAADWYESQARIAAEVRKARERTLAVIRERGDELTVGAQVFCDIDMPDNWSPRPKCEIR